MKLSGDRCQCSVCKEYFNSTAAFDKHRVCLYGSYGERRCLSVIEMQNKGMCKNAKDFWITAKSPDFEYRPTSKGEKK